jgi:ribonucleoside-diphosphate reductase alpha chain
VPLETYVSKFTNMRFEPAGMTDDPDIRMASSVVDYIFRRLALDFLPFERRAELGIYTAKERAAQARAEASGEDVDLAALAASAPISTEAKTETKTETRAETKAEAKAEAKPAEKAAGRAAGRAAETVAVKPAPASVGSSMELLERVQHKESDAPLCFTCGTKMRPAGSCYVCEGCGSTSGCS